MKQLAAKPDNEMTEQKISPEDNAKKWTRQDEENLLLEISEDRRLVRLGIDPDGISLDILLELKKRMAEIKRVKGGGL